MTNVDRRAGQRKNLLQWGSLGTSGGAVFLLMTMLSMLGQQGDQIAELQQRLEETTRARVAEQTEVELQVVRLRHQVQQARDDVAWLRRYKTDPDRHPDGWGRLQDTQRMNSFRKEVQQLLAEEREKTQQLLAEERLRWVGEGGPLHLQQLLNIQRAIAGVPTDEPDAWTQDGRPRVQSVSHRLGAPVSESQRDRAWILLQAAKTLRR